MLQEWFQKMSMHDIYCESQLSAATPSRLGSVLLIFLSHLSSLQAARTWYWKVWRTPPFVACSSSHRALNCLESKVPFILHSTGFLFFNRRERQKEDQRLVFWRAHVTSVQYFLWFTRRHLCYHAVVCTLELAYLQCAAKIAPLQLVLFLPVCLDD